MRKAKPTTLDVRRVAPRWLKESRRRKQAILDALHRLKRRFGRARVTLPNTVFEIQQWSRAMEILDEEIKKAKGES